MNNTILHFKKLLQQSRFNFLPEGKSCSPDLA